MGKFKNRLLSIVTGLALVAAFALSIILFRQNHTLKTENNRQQLFIAQQSQLIDSLSVRRLATVMPTLIDRIEEELKDNPARTLSDETISMIATMSYSYKPYNYSKGDSLSVRKLSPERGQLLLLLSGLNIDTSSLQKIFLRTTFSGADLRNADLSGKYLTGTDLSEADLSNGILQGSNLSKANLSFSNLWGAMMDSTILANADLTRTDLRWAKLNESNLRGAIFIEADMSSVQMRRSDLRGAMMKWTDLTGAVLNESNLSTANMFRTTLVRTQLTGTNLSEANLTVANLTEATLMNANLIGINLTDALLNDLAWFSRLEKWQVVGLEELKSSYKVAHEVANGKSLYRMKKLTN